MGNFWDYVADHTSVLFELVAVSSLLARWFAVPSDRKRTELLLCICMPIAPACFLLINAALVILTRIVPMKVDLYIYMFCRMVGSPSFELRQFANAHHWFLIVNVIDYNLFFGSIIATIAVVLWHQQTRADLHQAMCAFSVNFLIAPLIYMLLPVAGPAYAFADFPNLPAAVVPHMIAINAPPNGIPSLHVSTAMIAFWFMRRWKPGAILGAIHLALTTLAVLTTGEHYVLDAIAALPYSIAIVYASVWLTRFNSLSASPLSAFSTYRQPPVGPQS